MIVPFYHQENSILIVKPGEHVVWHDTHTDTNAIFLFRSILIHLQENASLEYIDRRLWSEATCAYTMITVFADADSTFSYQGLHTGARYAYTHINLVLKQKGANAQIRIGSIARGKNVHHIVTNQNHMVPNTTSSCWVRSVVYDCATTKYEGAVCIDPSAQKCIADQKHKSLLLSDNAREYARPRLAIHAHDVQCAHGSAIGQLDAEQLFYMQTRGIAPQEAQRILVRAFFDELYTHDQLRASVCDEI